MNWTEFKQHYQKELQHLAGFEEKFVELVLQNVSGLDASDVVPQYHFVDDKGGNRYIDFMIINKEKNWRLPIELDGYAKMVGNGEEYHRFNDFLERQNALISRFGLVLRYSNKAMFNQSSQIVAEIEEVLGRQSRAKSVREIQQKHTQQVIAEYEQKLKRLQAAVPNDDLLAGMKQIQQELQQLRRTQAQVQTPVHVAAQADGGGLGVKKAYWLAGSALAVLLAGVSGYMLSGGSDAEPAAVSRAQIKAKIAAVDTSGVMQGDRAVRRPQPEILPVQTVEPQPAEPVPEPEAVPSEKVQAAAVAPKPVVKQAKVRETAALPEAKIEAANERDAGNISNVCGRVAEVKTFAGGTYLNLGARYPNQDMTLVVWKQSDLARYLGQTVCTYGEVKLYKGRPQINVNSLKALKVR